MAKSRAQVQLENNSQISGEILAAFLNEKDIKVGLKQCIEASKTNFKITIPQGFIEKVTDVEIDEGIRQKETLFRLFDQMIASKNLYDVGMAHDYVFQYNSWVNPFVDIQSDGSIGHVGMFCDDESMTIIGLFAFLVITFLQVETSISRVHKCEECKKYFVYKWAREIKYCPKGKCKNAAGNLREKLKGAIS